jgi:hypothetical protein
LINHNELGGNNMKEKRLLLLFVFFLFSTNIAFSKTNSFTSSSKCRTCHVDIYNFWSDGMHSKSISDPIFNSAFIKAYFDKKEEARILCLSCHAPITLSTKDYDLKDSITREGITCDFCHSIKDIKITPQKNTAIIQPGKIKFGPRLNAKTPFHVTQFSPIHLSSELCSTCHEYKNKNGIAILSTYSEWREGPYKGENKVCQTCHMPKIEGKLVLPTIKELSSKYIIKHDESGSHSLEQVKRALNVTITNVTRKENNIIVDVEVKNAGSGHSVPTGLPSKKIVLTIYVENINKKPIASQSRIYQKILVDQNGKTLDDSHVFFDASKIESDNRIRPKETRYEQFFFNVPTKTKLNIEAKLSYSYEPVILEKTEMNFDITSNTYQVEK